MSVHRLVWHIYNTFDLLGIFGAMDGGAERRENLIAFSRHAERFESGGYRGVFAFVSQLRRLLYAKTVMNAGQGQQALMELTGMKSYPAGLTMNAARRVGDGFCRRAVELCLQTDVRMKTSYDDPERLLELLVVELAQEARRG